MNFHFFATLSLILLNAHIAFSSSNYNPKTAYTHLPVSAFWIQNHWPAQESYSAPHQWRNTRTLSNMTTPYFNQHGLEHLDISGSSPLTVKNMHWLKGRYGKNNPIYLVDLRQETHLYINNLPISLFYQKDEINWGKSLKYINEAEQFWVTTLKNKGYIILNELGKPHNQLKVAKSPSYTSIYNAQREAELAAQKGFVYFRIPVPDYLPPSPAQVDVFLELMKNRPHNTWVHFHCAGGKGRTTTFMVMSDILANANTVNFNDIILRQSLQGGINLLAPSKSLHTQTWKKKYHLAREQFIRLFYQYIHSGSHHHQSFTQWLNNQNNNAYKLILKTNSYEK